MELFEYWAEMPPMHESIALFTGAGEDARKVKRKVKSQPKQELTLLLPGETKTFDQLPLYVQDWLKGLNGGIIKKETTENAP